MPSLTPKSDAALERFDHFCARIRERLEVGKRSYGDASLERPLTDLIEEIRQEILDQGGWAFLAFVRLEALEREVAAMDLVRAK